MRMFHHGCMHLFPQVRRNTHCRDRTRRGKHHFVPILCSGSNLAFFPLGCTAVPGLELGTRLLFVDWITDEITPLSMWRLPRRRTEIAMNHSLIKGSDRWTILPVIDWSHEGDSHLLDTNWPDRRFQSQVEINPALFCGVVHSVLRRAAFHLVPLALMLCFVNNLDDCEEK